VAESVCLSVIVAAELRYGCARKESPPFQRRVEDFLSEVPVLHFDVPADSEYGGIRAQLEAAGQANGIERSADRCACMRLGRDRGDGERWRVQTYPRAECGELAGV
jgi:predicted nucleic acid-binding protein